MKIEKISLNLAMKLGDKLNKNSEEILVLNYGLFMLLHTLIAILITILLGIVTNKLEWIVMISISSALLKCCSGGVHASSPERCIIIGLLLSYILVILGEYINENLNINSLCIFILSSFLFSYFIIYKKCPVGSKNKPLRNVETRNKLRKKAFKLVTIYIMLILILFYMVINFKTMYMKKIIISITLGMLLQIFVLTNLGGFVIKLIDNILNVKNRGINKL